MASEPEHLVAELEAAARRYPSCTLHFSRERASTTLPLLVARARSLAGALRANGVEPGDAVGILLPTGSAFLELLFAVLVAGAAAVPLPPLDGVLGKAERTRRVRAIVRDARLAALVHHDGALPPEVLAGAARSLSVERLERTATRASLPELAKGDVAIVQYTSGSTAEPKGVVLTHANVLASVHAIRDGVRLTSRDVNGQWLPLYHDMGLVGLLSGIFCGVEQHLFPASTFLRDPLGWLTRFGAFAGTIFAAPNFAYEHLVRAYDDEEPEHLDLSAWRVGFNGGEPVDSTTLERFEARFSRHGLRSDTLFPVYGLAEATLAVAFPPLGAPRRVIHCETASLSHSHRVRRRTPGAAGCRSLVSVGRAVRGHAIRVVTPERRPCEAGEVGEIEVRGPAVMREYWGRSEATREALTDGWLRTGDLGFLLDHELYVTGRRKEMMIMHGVNYYPMDVESIVRQVPGVWRGHCVAFCINEGQAGERMVVVAESDASQPREVSRDTIRRELQRELGIEALDVELVRPGALPRTSSGKYQRTLLKQRLELGGLSVSEEAPTSHA